MPARMASADVFVFPSLFEGSAVVTYEALASGLPSVVTPNAGSVVRDGLEGFIVPASQVNGLACRMEQLGSDTALRARMASAARSRALAFDWPRYHASLVAAVDELLHYKGASAVDPADKLGDNRAASVTSSHGNALCFPVR